ncbi:MAG: cupin domain-containing protein [Ignavibacteria bacterium]|nr:cupin domain-containing protein [Ignavibacteria bacterium]
MIKICKTMHFIIFFFLFTFLANAQPISSVILKPDEGDFLWLKQESKDELGSGVELQVYIDHKEFPYTRGSFAKVSLGVDGESPTHKHEKTEEVAYILSGEGMVINYINEELIEMPIKEGYVWYNAPGVWHTFRNTGDKPLSLIMAVIPNEKKGLLSFFRKVGVEPGKEPTIIPSDEFKKIAAEHDMILKPILPLK